ncbi:MAG: hypothetical protein E7012_05945 [Alphaproteobacteria bacterium]|nr:hypothetical protein [Alphaproteobacteria bacterium]
MLKTIFSKTVSFLLVFIPLSIIFIPIFGFLFLWFDDAGTCLDIGGVWDGTEKRCRNDCLTWRKDYGCIKFTPQQIECAKSKTNSQQCMSLSEYRILCDYNQKAWNLDTNECFFAFKITDCNLLSGNWHYPPICQ